jgi:diguanylate cyclase (GGDEF)-like protein
MATELRSVPVARARDRERVSAAPLDLESELAAAADDRGRVDVICRRAEAIARAGNIDLALELLSRADSLARQLEDTAALGRCAAVRANCEYLRSDYSLAHLHGLEASAASERAGDRKGASSALLLAAACQYQMGAHEQAQTTLIEILDAVTDAPDDEIEFRASNMLGMVLKDQDETQPAKEQFERAIAAGTRMGNQFYLQRARTNQASLFLDIGKKLRTEGREEEADACLRACAQTCESVRAGVHGPATSRENAAGCAGVLGQIYVELGRGEAALALFREMEEHGAAMGNAVLQGEALLHQGLYFSLAVAHERALECLERSLELARSANARRLVLDIHAALRDLHERRGDLRAALDYAKGGQRLKEELTGGELKAASQARRLWGDYQRAVREARTYKELAESLMRDKEELSKRSTELVKAAFEDSLTGLDNRRSLDGRLADLIGTLVGGGVRMSLAMVDIDNFKAVNDGHSHAVGDEVLRFVATMIRTHCREGDVSARFGGDEFVVCLIGTPIDRAAATLGRLREVVAAHDWNELRPGLAVTVSVGLTQLLPEDNARSLLGRADNAMYRAKQAGRDRVCVE